MNIFENKQKLNQMNFGEIINNSILSGFGEENATPYLMVKSMMCILLYVTVYTLSVTYPHHIHENLHNLLQV